MNTRNKKNIGILLAAIMVISIFAMVVPAISQSSEEEGITPQWHDGWPEKNITVVTPTNLSCVHDEIFLSWVWNGTTTPANLTHMYVGISKNCDDCIDEYKEKMCSGGCSNYTMDLAADPWKNVVSQCDSFCVLVWNETSWPGTAVNINGSKFTYDAGNPCIDNCRVLDGKPDATGNKWFNATDSVITANVTACDKVCCGIHNVTWNTSLFEHTGRIREFVKTGAYGDICEYTPEACPGYYYDNTTEYILQECNVTDFTITARDNSSDKDGVNNTATCIVTFGVDKKPPKVPADPCCEEKPGAILVYWNTVADEGPAIPSGVKEYNVYDQDENGTAGYSYQGTVKATDFGVYTCNGLAYQYKYEFKSSMGVVGNYFTFKINATDYALNRQLTLSNATEPQLLTQGPPDDIDLEVPEEATGCGGKDYLLNATVKDEYGSPLSGIDVCFNTTDGQVCPTQKKTAKNGVATVDYTSPKVVFMPYNVTVCAWVCNNESIVECKNILIVPKQAENATIIAVPDMIMAGEGENNESLIVVELVDKNGYPVGGSGNQDVCVFTDAGTFKSTGTWMVCGKMELGMFFAMLVSGDTPTLATVSADVGALYFPETTVAFAGYGSYDIPLYKGWNLISLPLVPEDDAAGMVLLGIAPELSEAWAYDGCDDEWTSGKFEGPWWVGDLETMEVERGYWLEMNESATLTVTGWTMVPGNVPPPTYNVCEGWNLVGYYALPPDKVMTAKKYFTEVTVSYKVLGFDGAPQGWVTVDKGDNLYSGKGYWMKAENDGEITPQEWV
jgi:hypothetical protein